MFCCCSLWVTLFLLTACSVVAHYELHCSCLLHVLLFFHYIIMSAKNSHYFWRLSCRIIILFAGFWEICLETPMNPLCKISSLPMFRVNLVSCSTVPVHLSSTYHVWQVTTSTQPFHFGWRTRATILSSSTTMCSTFMRWLQINMGTLQASMCCICSVLLLLDGTPPGKFAVLFFSLVVKKYY